MLPTKTSSSSTAFNPVPPRAVDKIPEVISEALIGERLTVIRPSVYVTAVTNS